MLSDSWPTMVLLKVNTPFSWVASKPQASKVELIEKPSLVRIALQLVPEKIADLIQEYRKMFRRVQNEQALFTLYDLFLSTVNSSGRKI